MDPMLALQLFQQTMGSAEARIQAARELAMQKQAMREQARQQSLGLVGQMAMEQAATGADMGAIGPLLQAAAASLPGGQSPYVQRGISQMEASLQDYDPAPQVGFNEEDAQNIRDLVAQYQQTNPEIDVDTMIGLVSEAFPAFAQAPTTQENLVRPIVEGAMMEEGGDSGVLGALGNFAGNALPFIGRGLMGPIGWAANAFDAIT
jgi:hypothetical protein